MEKKIILRLSNGLGNQMFMYASAYSLAKKLNRKLLIDNETAFRSRKNISNFALSYFNTCIIFIRWNARVLFNNAVSNKVFLII